MWVLYKELYIISQHAKQTKKNKIYTECCQKLPLETCLPQKIGKIKTETGILGAKTRRNANSTCHIACYMWHFCFACCTLHVTCCIFGLFMDVYSYVHLGAFIYINVHFCRLGPCVRFPLKSLLSICSIQGLVFWRFSQNWGAAVLPWHPMIQNGQNNTNVYKKIDDPCRNVVSVQGFLLFSAMYKPCPAAVLLLESTGICFW